LKRRFRTNRIIDPLSPVYALPSYSITKPEEPKFLRDTLYIRDIDGAFALPEVSYIKERNVDPYTEIPGTKARKMFIPRDSIDRFNVKAINNDGLFKTQRSTNPLEPKYSI